MTTLCIGTTIGPGTRTINGHVGQPVVAVDTWGGAGRHNDDTPNVGGVFLGDVLWSS
jgi:hypothetical protein